MTAGADAPARRPARPGLRPRLYAAPADGPRSRRASDLTRLGASILALAAASASAVPAPGFARAFDRFLRAAPPFMTPVWQVAMDAALVLAVVLAGAAVVRRRFSVARDVVLAALIAVLVWLVVGRIVVGSWPDVVDAIRASGPPPWYPALRVAVPAAAVLTAAPHLVRPMRRLGRWSVGVNALAVVVLGTASSIGSLAGLLLAVGAAAAVHLAVGSTAGRPGLDVIAGDLAELGVEVSALEAADRQEAGVLLLHAIDAEARPLDIKVYGRDAHDAEVLSTLWRTVWYRDSTGPLRLGRLQQVEHEAFVTLLAAQAGVPTDVVVTAGAASTGDAMLVLRPRGRLVSLTDRRPDAAEVWDLVARLHSVGINHGEVDEGHLSVGADGVLGMRDFRGAAVADPAHRSRDFVQALVTTVVTAGVPVAVAAAKRHLGDEELAATLPLLQPAVVTPAQRRMVRADEVDLVAMRADVAAAIGTEVPTLQQLRRLSAGSILRVVLPAVAVVALLSMVAGIDLAELWEAVRSASWWLLAAALVAGQVPRLSQAVSTVGASPAPLPLGPVYALQLAVSYINIAVPSAAARMALNIRFFQRHGMAPGTALAAGALDGFSGFIVQAVLLVTLLVFTPASLDLELGRAVDGVSGLLVVIGAIVGVAVVVLVAVAPLRRFVVRWARRLAIEAVAALRGLQSPRRLAMLFGGNLATEVLFASVLGLFAAALGYPVALAAVLITNIAVALLSGLLPVPGGVGVAEGGLTIGLVQAGVPEEAAFAAVLCYRMATFYLPPIWGYFALRWLERHQHL